MRQVLIYPGEDGYWVAEVPSLPGCISQGKTRKEALINAKEAVDAYINALKEDGLSVPEERFEALLERIAIDPKVMVGKPVIRGTRLTIECILERLACGSTIHILAGQQDDRNVLGIHSGCHGKGTVQAHR